MAKYVCSVKSVFFVCELGQTRSWWKQATLYHGHVTFITELILTRSRSKFNEHVNYCVRNFQMREPSKWKSACCTDMSWKWMLANFLSCKTYSESFTSLGDWHTLKCMFVGINQQLQNYFCFGDFTTGPMNSKCCKIPMSLNFCLMHVYIEVRKLQNTNTGRCRHSRKCTAML
jgi:hypothetical protein